MFEFRYPMPMMVTRYEILLKDDILEVTHYGDGDVVLDIQLIAIPQQHLEEIREHNFRGVDYG